MPLLLLYGVTVTDGVVTAQGYTVRYATHAAQTMTVLEHDGPETRQWRPVRGGLRVRVPRQQAGHHLHESITLKRPRRA